MPCNGAYWRCGLQRYAVCPLGSRNMARLHRRYAGVEDIGPSRTGLSQIAAAEEEKAMIRLFLYAFAATVTAIYLMDVARMAMGG